MAEHTGPGEAGRLLEGTLRALGLALLAGVVGVAGGYGALAFLFGIELVQDTVYGLPLGAHLSVASLEPWRLVVGITAGGALVALLVARLAPGGRVQGPADAVLAVLVGEGRMSTRAGLLAAGASVLSIGAGASVGRYGPAVHLGATLGATVGRLLRLDRRRRVVLLGCGVAAAIGASFNAPLAGVLFAQEAVLGGYRPRAIMPVVVASAVGTGIARLHGSDVSLFGLPLLHLHTPAEYPLFALLGVLGGAVAVLFMRAMVITERVLVRVAPHPALRGAAGGLALSLLVLALPPVFGLGEDATRGALAGHFPWAMMLALVFAKLLATSLSLASGFAGGVFGPALFMGAMLGGACGQLVETWLPGIASSPAVYGVAGMGAVISRVIGAPIATILIAFELTGSYPLTVAVMVSVVVAGLVTSRLFPSSWFSYQVRARGVDPSAGREVRILAVTPITRVLRPVPCRLSAGSTLGAAEEALARAEAEHGYVVDGGQCLLGVLTLPEVVHAIEIEGARNELVAAWMHPPGVVLGIDESLNDAMTAFEGHEGEQAAVVDRAGGGCAGGRLVGVVDAVDLVHAYAAAVAEARAEELG